MAKKRSASDAAAFDPSAGQAAFKELEPALRAIPADEVTLPNSDAQDAAITALSLVAVARDPERHAKLSLLPDALFAKDTIDKLEKVAWATWYAHTQVLSGSVSTTGARVDATLYENAGQHLAKVLKLLEYHVGGVAEVAAEIADIRSGSGYQDRASDLVRAAALWERWRHELEGDKRFFDPADGEKARGFAQAIVQALRSSLGSNLAEQTDLRNRAWTLLNRLYDDVRAAGLFVFRGNTAELDLFVALRQAIHPRPRGKANGQPNVTPPTPAVTADAAG